MKDYRNIIAKLKNGGFCITKIRTAILRLFEKKHTPLAETEIRLKLSRLGINPNKTTVYRELAFLIKHGFVKEVDFGDGKKRYENNFKEHHHHLICTKCKNVDEIGFAGDLKHMEDEVKSKKQFKITEHILEFFGVCGKCSK